MLSMSEKQWFSLNIARVSVALLLKLGHILEHKADVVSIYYLSKLTPEISFRLNPELSVFWWQFCNNLSLLCTSQTIRITISLLFTITECYKVPERSETTSFNWIWCTSMFNCNWMQSFFLFSILLKNVNQYLSNRSRGAALDMKEHALVIVLSMTVCGIKWLRRLRED